jgi:hypothetical protein
MRFDSALTHSTFVYKKGARMFELNVKFSNVEDIEEFHKVVCNMNCDVDAVKGSYVVDAKSFMGLLTMDSSTPITVIVHSQDLSLRKEFEKWI